MDLRLSAAQRSSIADVQRAPRCCKSIFWTCEPPALQVGHPDYEVMGGSATYKGRDLLELEPEDRARAGLFMSFQSPVEVGL